RAPQGYSQEQTKKKSVKNKDVEIFVTSWCGYCRKLEAFLKKNRIKYKKYDIEKSAYGKKRHQELGGGGIPVTTIGDTVVRGYDPATIQRLLDS
ncbi:MAG: NrdH-like redox domain-containing protein, partial [Candidatus Omnitrophica bacterium]|nr:NrdH-like redox domain-containing protein [Candidatus Omnitrophota bacterium]